MEGADGHFGAILLTESEETFDKVGLDRVVGVDKGNVGASSDGEAGVAGGREALVFLMDDFNTGVALFVDVAKFAAHVGGAVVDEDDLEMVIGLGKDGVDATLEELRDVIDGDDDGDEGGGVKH